MGFCPNIRYLYARHCLALCLRNFLEKSSLRIFKNFEKWDIFRCLFTFTARAYPYRRDFLDL